MESSTQSSSVSSWSDFVMRRIRMLVPVGFKTEIIELIKLAAPVILSQVLFLGVGIVSSMFCGHLGRTELAAVALALAVINVTGIAIGNGLATACDTLISQIFGSRNLLRIGVVLQQAILILLLACFPCWAILINTEPILLAIKQTPEVARMSQLYVKIFMPALPASFMYSLEIRYLQNQGIIWPQVIIGAVVNLLNALINYIFLFLLNLGVPGSAAANTISQFSMAVFLYCYIIWKGLHKATWGGWSRACLQDWGSFFHLAIPSMIMLCVEWWTYEIGNFLAGLINEVELGAETVVFGLGKLANIIPLGWSIAGCVRVGNALGAGDTEQAKLSAKVTMFCGVSVSTFLSILVGSLRNYVSYIYTYDEQIIERAADVLTVYAASILVEAALSCLGGIIRGTGKQRVGAVCNILGYYGVGYPIGVSLMFAAKLGIKGLSIGLFICVSLQSIFLIFYLVRLNWKKASVEAQMRAGVCGSSRDTSPKLVDSLAHADTMDLTEPEAAINPPEEGLSFRTLVLRRGLTMAVMLLILAAGIIINPLIIYYAA